VAFINHGKLLSEGTLEELLREQNVHELRVTPADAGAVKSLEAAAKEKGLTVVSSRAPMRTLEAFYLDMLKRKDDDQ
jgi:ABC-type multidrug transport system ATPase subunit